MKNPMALWEAISGRLTDAGISLCDERARKLESFHRLLIDWNKRMDLTAVLDENEMVDRHYVDSLSPLKSDGLVPEKVKVIDVGSGAGFPGLPLAIARPDIQVILLDAQQKRVRFLQEAAAYLNLVNVKAYHGRAEEFAHDPSFREAFHIATARAVASLPTLMELLLPFVVLGGRTLCWKGPAVMEEIPAAKRAAILLGGKLEAPIPTPIPGRDWAHVLIPCLKTKKTLQQYPRKAGTPGREPLGTL